MDMSGNGMSMTSTGTPSPMPTGGSMSSMGGMDMGGMDGGGMSCKISMTWNWYTVGACFISKQWQVTSAGMFAGSCIGVIFLVVSLEFLRRAQREYDAYVRAYCDRKTAAAGQRSPDSSPEASFSAAHLTSADAKAPATSNRAIPHSGLGQLKRSAVPSHMLLIFQLVRALIHAVQFGVAYFIMLLAMYYNGYIIICIIIGAFLGFFIFGWDQLLGKVLDGPRNLATRAKLSNVTKGLRGEEKANTTRAAQRKKTANPKTSFRDFHSDVPLPQNKTGPSTSKSGRDGATTRASTFIKDLTTTIQDVTWPQIMYIFYASFGCVFLFHYAVNVKGCWGPSMLPTLDTRGNAVLISLFHHGGRFVQRGDLVSYVHPMHRNIRGIKRVIGLPGDLVLRDTPGEDHGEGLLLRVPEGHCWIVGDNLNWSRDSRHFGPLPLALIRGKVMARIKPWKDRKWFWRNDYVDVPEEVDGAG